MCEFNDAAWIVDAELNATVQRTWSNASARAGREPCLPAASGPCFLAVPQLSDDVNANVFGLGRALTFRLDRTSGQNGEKLYLTITRTGSDPNFGGAIPFAIIAQKGDVKNWIETARCFDSGRRRPPLSTNGVGARPFHPSRVHRHQHLKRICAHVGGPPRRPPSPPPTTIRASETSTPPADSPG